MSEVSKPLEAGARAMWKFIMGEVPLDDRLLREYELRAKSCILAFLLAARTRQDGRAREEYLAELKRLAGGEA